MIASRRVPGTSHFSLLLNPCPWRSPTQGAQRAGSGTCSAIAAGMGWTGIPGPLFPWLFTGADLFRLCPVFFPRASLRPEGMAGGGTLLAGKHSLIERDQASICARLAIGSWSCWPGAWDQCASVGYWRRVEQPSFPFTSIPWGCRNSFWGGSSFSNERHYWGPEAVFAFISLAFGTRRAGFGIWGALGRKVSLFPRKLPG